MQLWTRVDAEFLDESLACLLIFLERISLASRAIESTHELPSRSLAERILGDQPLELTDYIAVVTERELGVDAFLHARDPEFLELRPLGLGPGGIDEIAQRRSAPQSEGPSEMADGLSRMSLGQPLFAL